MFLIYFYSNIEWLAIGIHDFDQQRNWKNNNIKFLFRHHFRLKIVSHLSCHKKLEGQVYFLKMQYMNIYCGSKL